MIIARASPFVVAAGAVRQSAVARLAQRRKLITAHLAVQSYFRRPAQLRPDSRPRAMISPCISAAPSKMFNLRASHSKRLYGQSSVEVLSLWICRALPGLAKATREVSKLARTETMSE